MKHWLPGTALALALVTVAPTSHAQGVPVFDGSNLAKNVEQLKQHLADAERQIAQIEELKSQLEKLLNIEELLGGVLGSIEGLNEIASLYNSVEDLRARAAKITDLSRFSFDLSLGNFDGLLKRPLAKNAPLRPGAGRWRRQALLRPGSAS